MKRFLCLLLSMAMALSLLACSRTVSTSDDQSESDVSTPVEITEEPVDTELEEAAPVETPIDWTNINPLTGETTETDISTNRPIAVMLNNIRQALPQSGNSQADILYEVPEEGGITRIMALYQDISDVGYLGSIRSTRPYYVKLAVSQDAILVHAGGSGKAYKTIQKYMGSIGFTDLDFLSKGTRTADIFWREQSRFDAGYASEHTLFTSSDKIQSYLESHSDEVNPSHRESYEFVHTFAEDGTPADGTNAKDINVTCSGYKSTEFVYDANSNTYKVSEFGSPYMDAAAGVQVAVTNVIVILTDITETGDAKNHVNVPTNGRGNGYYINGGKLEPIIWSKVDERDPYTFYKADGVTTFDLGVGKSYICLIDKGNDVTVDGTVLDKPEGVVRPTDLSSIDMLSDEDAE